MTPTIFDSVDDVAGMYDSATSGANVGSDAYVHGFVLYSSCLFMCNMIAPGTYKQILWSHTTLFRHPSPLGLSELFVINANKYMQGTFRETHYCLFRALVMKQLKRLVPFEYHIDYEVTDRYIDACYHSGIIMTADFLIDQYYDERLNLGELSLLSAYIRSDAANISRSLVRLLPHFLYSRNSNSKIVRTIFRHTNARVLLNEDLDMKPNVSLSYYTCSSLGYKWKCDLPFRFCMEMPSHQLKEMISFLKGGYIFGQPYLSDSGDSSGVYMRKMRQHPVRDDFFG